MSMQALAAAGSFDLEGRLAVVTGGSGLLGRTFAAALAEHGAAVAVLDLDGDSAEVVARGIRELGGEALAVRCDVADPVAIEEAVQKINDWRGVPHVLVNNAATKTDDIAAFFSDTTETDLERWRKVMSVNLDGMFLVARAFGRNMVEARRGSIIQTASVYGIVAPDLRIYQDLEFLGAPMTSPVTYTVSKAGVVGLSRHLAIEWAHANVRVNTLAPGGVRGNQDERFIERYSRRVPLGRMAEPHEVGGAVVFLASDASTYVTGQVITVDGGLTAW